MMTLPKKLALLLLLAWCSPLYVLVRYFYGRSFFGLVLVALVFNLIGLPFVAILLEQQGIRLYPTFYNPALNEMLVLLALFALPLHVAWMIFYKMSGDTRYDLDSPGRVPVPFVHPWIADGVVALAAPYLLLKVSAWVPFRPYSLEVLSIDMPTLEFSANWFGPAVVMSLAYAVAAFISVPAPSFRLNSRVKRGTPKGPAFDVATIAAMPERSFDSLGDIHARRSADLAGLVGRR